MSMCTWLLSAYVEAQWLLFTTLVLSLVVGTLAVCDRTIRAYLPAILLRCSASATISWYG